MYERDGVASYGQGQAAMTMSIHQLVKGAFPPLGLRQQHTGLHPLEVRAYQTQTDFPTAFTYQSRGW